MRFAPLAILLTSAAISHAAPVTLINPGFEDITGESPFNEFTFGPLVGWDLYEEVPFLTDGGDGPTFYIGTLTPFEVDPVASPGVFVYFPSGAPEGQRVAICFNIEGSGNTGAYGLRQTLTDTYQPNTTYTLEVEVGNIASGTALSGQFFNLDGFPGYQVQLLAGDTVVAQDDNTLGGLIPEGAFATSTVQFTTPGEGGPVGQPITIRLVSLNTIDPAFPGADIEVDFDDVRLDAAPAVCPGDVNGDGLTTTADITLVVSNLGAGSPGATGTPGDANNDGETTTADITFVVSNLGADCS